MKKTRRNGSYRWVSWLIVLSLVVGVLAGCEDDKNPPKNIVSVDDVGLDTRANDGRDVSVDSGGEDVKTDVSSGACDGVVCLPVETCVDGLCKGIGDIGFSCETPRDLGTLTSGTPLQIDGNSDGQPVLLRTGCAVEDRSAQSVFKFRVAENAEVRAKFLETTQPVVMELREGGCVDGSTAAFCDAQPQSFEAEAGKDYFLIVEARQDYATGDFKLELEAITQVCSPAGSWSCDGTKRVQCYAGTELRSFECGSECSSGVCAGDMCENAIVVNGSATVAGDSHSFGSLFDFKNEPSCSTEGRTGPMTPGSEVIFSLPGLKSGQTISVDTTHSQGRAIIGVMRSCGVSSGCLAADDTAGKLDWPVDEAGDYFVIIDRSNPGNVSFDYRIEVLD